MFHPFEIKPYCTGEASKANQIGVELFDSKWIAENKIHTKKSGEKEKTRRNR